MNKTPHALTYDTATETFRVASRKFREVTSAYRARTVDDKVFLAARAEFNLANAEHDKAIDAYVAECERTGNL